MIVFDLQCDQRHGFEAWFPGSIAFAAQRAGNQIVCPYCGSTEIEKAAMAPRLAMKTDAAEASDVIPKLAAMQRRMLEDSTWVGDGFAGKARAMAEGEEPASTIHGTATPDDAKALRDDGIGVLPLIFPVVPPERRN